MPPPKAALRAGLPLVALTLGGWLGLSFFIKGRLDVEDARRRVPDDRMPAATQRSKAFSLEGELARLRAGGAERRDYELVPLQRPPEAAEDR